jgi:toxin ParE1/3/4
VYKTPIAKALAKLSVGPNVPGITPREEIFPNLRTLHVARRGRRGGHFIMDRAAEGQVIEVLRILHDAMKLARGTSPDIV